MSLLTAIKMISLRFLLKILIQFAIRFEIGAFIFFPVTKVHLIEYVTYYFRRRTIKSKYLFFESDLLNSDCNFSWTFIAILLNPVRSNLP